MKRQGDTDLIWSLLCSKATTIKKKCNGVKIHRLSVTVSIHKLFQLSASLDPEENFIPVLQHQKFKLEYKHSTNTKATGDTISRI